MLPFGPAGPIPTYGQALTEDVDVRSLIWISRSAEPHCREEKDRSTREEQNTLPLFPRSAPLPLSKVKVKMNSRVIPDDG